MTAHVKRWIAKSPSVPTYGSYKTTVTIRDPILMSITFPGRWTRKEALGKVFDQLVRENQYWSPGFLQALKELSR